MEIVSPIFCRKCGAELMPGRGDFYVVNVEAFADPSPPVISEEALKADHERVMEELVGKMKDYSEQELLDMVHRRMSFYLCAGCYRGWIEDPTG